MSPAWRRLLSKHRGKTLVEFCRRPKIDERIAGFIIDFSDTLILLHRFDWNTFSLDGYIILRNEDIAQRRFFSQASRWENRAIQKLELKAKPIPDFELVDWPEALHSIAQRSLLINIHCEIKWPDECYIGKLLRTTDTLVEIDDLNTHAEWTGPRRFKLKDITRLDFESGYERALTMTAPSRNLKSTPAKSTKWRAT